MTDAFQKGFHAAFNAPRDQLVALVERVMGAEVASLERVTQGYVNEVYRAELAPSQTVVVRIRRRGGVSFTSEAWALGACRRAGVPVPVVYAVTTLHGDEPLEVMLLSLVPGRPLGELWPELGEQERRLATSQVGRTLRALHLEVGGWGRRAADGSWEFATWEGRAAAETQGREADVPVLQEAGLTEAETDDMMAAVRTMLTRPAPFPSLCHGDIGMDHVFVDDNLDVTGVIDFGAWRGGPPELDLAVLTMYHPDVSLAGLVSSYGGAPFDDEVHRRVLSERLAVGMGFLAHDLRQDNADYLELALLGLRGTLRMWQTLS